VAIHQQDDARKDGSDERPPQSWAGHGCASRPPLTTRSPPELWCSARLLFGFGKSPSSDRSARPGQPRRETHPIAATSSRVFSASSQLKQAFNSRDDASAPVPAGAGRGRCQHYCPQNAFDVETRPMAVSYATGASTIPLLGATIVSELLARIPRGAPLTAGTRSSGAPGHTAGRRRARSA